MMFGCLYVKDRMADFVCRIMQPEKLWCSENSPPPTKSIFKVNKMCTCRT